MPLSSRILVPLLCLGLSIQALAQTPVWQSRYATVSPGKDALMASVVDSKGAVYTAANVDSAVTLTKFDRTGAVVWKQNNILSKAKGRHDALALNLDSAGNLVLYSASGVQLEITHNITRYKGLTGALINQTSFKQSTGWSVANKVQLDGANNIYLFHGTSRPTLTKLSPTGTQIWTLALPEFEASDFVVDSAGNSYCTGTVATGSLSSPDDPILVKVMSSGDHAWTFKKADSDRAFGQQVVLGPNGTVYMVGRLRLGTSSYRYYDLLAWKIDASTGTGVWSQRYTPTYTDTEGIYGRSFSDPVSGDLMVSGTRAGQPYIQRFGNASGAMANWKVVNDNNYTSWYIDSCSDGSGGALLLFDVRTGDSIYQLRLTRFDQAGTQLWSQRYLAANLQPTSASRVYLDSGGGAAVVVSNTNAGPWHLTDTLVERSAIANGTPINSVTTDTLKANHDFFRSVVKAADGGWAVLATSINEQDGEHPVVRRYAADGSLMWSTALLSLKNYTSSLKKIAIGPDGSVAIAADLADILVAKLNRLTGALMWFKFYDGPDQIENDLGGIGLDSAGNVYVSGTDRTYASDHDLIALKYASKTGDLLWERKYDEAKPADADTMAVYAGFAIITGSVGVNSERRPVVMRIRTDDGAAVWMNRFGGADNQGLLDAVNRYPNGDILAIGNRYVPTGGSNGTLLVRYNGATGATQWEKLSNGATSRLLCYDSAGNPITFLKIYYDCIVSKYSATNGALLWQTTIDGPDNSDEDYAAAITADPIGNVYISGTSVRHLSTGDVYKPFFACLSAVTGSVRWFSPYPNYNVEMGSPTGLIMAQDGLPLYFGNVFTFGFEGGNEDGLITKVQPPSVTRTFTGSVGFLNYLADPTQVPVAMEIRVAGTTNVVESRTIHVAADLTYSEAFSLPDGKYDVTFKASHWLRRKVANVVVIDATTVPLALQKLFNGDATGDNVVNEQDRQAVADALGALPGSGNWNPEADLNGDGKVDAKDQNIVEINFGKVGQ